MVVAFARVAPLVVAMRFSDPIRPTARYLSAQMSAVDGGGFTPMEPGTELSLQVSSPALLLNHMAERYSSTSRILMEFVDNSLDDAEALYDAKTSTYQRDVSISIFVSREERTLRILDNCRGMAPDTLARVVMRVGESRKRGASFVNGQFGFGMQAFRAAASTLTVRSRADGGAAAHQIRVERHQGDGFLLEEVDGVVAAATFGSGDSAEGFGSGTEITLSGFDGQWIDKSFSAHAIAREVESHFERLLDRSRLQVRVWDADAPGSAPPLVCQPVDYAALRPGASVRREVDLGGGQVALCNLCVLPSGTVNATAEPAAGSRAPRFFVSGRRIADCAATASFVKTTANRWTVWSHPQVKGFIDIRGDRAGPLQPVITRDEFKNTRGRQAAYQTLIDACEAPLAAAIEEANQVNSEKSLSRLEDTVTAVLARVAEDERREASARDRREKAEARKRRQLVAAVKKAEAEAEAAAAALAAAEAEEEAARPLADKMASGLGSMLGSAIESAARAVDPSITLAEQAAAEAMAAAEAAEAEARAEAEREARKQARRMKVLAPAGEQFTVRLVRGFESRPGPADPYLDEAVAAALAEASAATGLAELAAPPRERSRLVGSVIYVDVTHPDFAARWRQTRQGAPKVDERLCGYLATVVSSHYRERAYQTAARSRVDYAQAYESMIATYCKLEEGLRQVLPQLLKELEADAETAQGAAL